MKPYREFRIGEAAKRMAMSKATLKKMFDAGKIAGGKINTHRKIPDWEIKRYIHENGLPKSFYDRPPESWEILTCKGVADLLGCSSSTVKNLMDKEEIVGWKLGNDRRFYLPSIADYCKRQNLLGAEANIAVWIKNNTSLSLAV